MLANFSCLWPVAILAVLYGLPFGVEASRLVQWHGSGHPVRQRELLQAVQTVGVKKADFTTLAEADLLNGDIFFNETAFAGQLAITEGTQADGEQPLQFGVYDLSPFMVRELTTMLIQQMVRCRCPCE